jgi:hypothetical protein
LLLLHHLLLLLLCLPLPLLQEMLPLLNRLGHDLLRLLLLGMFAQLLPLLLHCRLLCRLCFSLGEEACYRWGTCCCCCLPSLVGCVGMLAAGLAAG